MTSDNEHYFDLSDILRYGKDREIEFMISPRGIGKLKYEMMNNDIGQDN